MHRSQPINFKAADDESRQVELSFSSEAPYERWFGAEILSHDPGAVDLTRLNDIGCLLFNHNRDKVIGRVDRAWVKDGKGYATVTFDDDAESEVIYQKVKAGTLKAVSTGYRVDAWEEVSANKQSSNGRFTGPCSIALKWWPFEISIVSVPADANVGVGRDLEDEDEREVEYGADYSYYERQMLLNKNLGGL